MSALEIARKLREEADEIIQDIGLGTILQSHGRVYYGGSYALDALAWPDIDINILMEPDPTSTDAFFDIGRRIAALPGVAQMRFNNCLRHRVEKWPVGLYWGVRLDYGKWQSLWKIDIWAIDAAAFDDSIAMMDRILDALTDETRRIIVETKNALLMPDGRTPVLSGYHIYQAVLFEGITDLDNIRAYLRVRGVQGV